MAKPKKDNKNDKLIEMYAALGMMVGSVIALIRGLYRGGLYIMYTPIGFIIGLIIGVVVCKVKKNK